MKRCVIVGGGEIKDFAYDRRLIQESDFIIAADRGYERCLQMNVKPHLLLGDFDSYNGDMDETIPVLEYPVEKDDTDSMLAVRRGLQAGCDRFLIYGSLDGPRLDHTVANFQTLQFLADHGAKGFLVGKTHIVTLLQNGKLCFPKEATGILSVFCMGKDAHGVTLTGLQYPLEDGTLTAGFPLGASNHFIGQEAAVSVSDGSLLLIYERENGLLYE